MKRSNLWSLIIILFLNIVAVSCAVDILYSESFVRPFQSYSFKSLEEKSRKKRESSSSSVLFQQAEETDDDDSSNETSDDGLKLPNETSWWTNATHERVNHRYYTAYILKPDANKFKEYWIHIPDLLLSGNNKTTRGEVQHKQLSNSYRRAVSQKLTFKFPFYGHETENITIATGGFVYVGEHVHSWLAATQYIAPLMANFDTTTSEDSNILYADTGEFFVVEWNQVVLRHQMDAGNFTFQVSLHKNGDIWFVYKNIPIEVKHVSDLHHPRKVGLSDAYLFTHTILTLSRRVIYEYHRVEVQLDNVKSGAVVVIKANPVCIAVKNCWDCMNSNFTQFNCTWCVTHDDRGGPFCSDEAGLHRRRQDWLDSQCNKQSQQVYCTSTENVPSSSGGGSTSSPSESGGEGIGSTKPTEEKVTVSQLATPKSKSGKAPSSSGNSSHLSGNGDVMVKKIQSSGLSAGGVVAVLFVLGTLVCLIGWVMYAYYNPQTPSGQFLIRYRPTRWRWPNSHGDVRYTASVHM